ncbi:conserved hypothetical protein [Vibrio nigripulchritudo SO65]|uniref:PAAR domain-containing protein n=1 Tax=Vibrio nigripulchritudo TaxID=28173 RepID=UPI0003B1CBB2|nr:PAAR domain-containing protein [Vibrio nigripulchritudo]CCN36297.1 conserved hypothetical protein [Vibrio nigripulchritudo AM115]CCN39395.1 conserved hypothetical protein [Vibrio nigripulchritudo FTn2]CCN63508.1 conserved hypothetical protein [Vibrio nigripulchritudo POn4]CCN78076.1 conserved hypothetical protein [Vibrio nigripulchritudo SO65]
MGKPAAHIGSAHTCPAVTGKIPHVGGPVAAGSPNVFVGGMPAARQGDMCVCVGPPDSIAAGSSGVFINGKPAARQGDGTSHGGSVASGNPTVLIGETGSGSGGGSSALDRSQMPKHREPPENNDLADAAEFVPVVPSLASTAERLEAFAYLDIPMAEMCQKGLGNNAHTDCECA